MEAEKEPMKSVHRDAPSEVVPRDDVRVGGSLARCPYCHDALAPETAGWVACRACLARHHQDCWKESLACGTCGHKVCMDGAVEFVAVERPAQHVVHERPWVRRAWWTLTVLLVPSTIGIGTMMVRDGHWDNAVVVVASMVAWLGFGLGWFERGRVRRVVEKRRTGGEGRR